MSTPKADRPLLELSSAAKWHAWLAANHATSDGAWLALAKKHAGAAAPGYEEAVEEALCWGWIDTTARRLDAERYLQLFTPRKPDGTWARSNKERVERLIAEGRMQPAGAAVIDAAKASGAWTLLDEIEALVMPEDLATALAADGRAAAGFAALPDSAKQIALYWIASAKRAETRARRITATVVAAAEGRSPQ
ncbi:MAG: YdeI/OmpD-associated family protein [Coriobacteriia bacterium]|nr:YdeI/OmpD-associated family protein [Coriobacteriia bacterium]